MIKLVLFDLDGTLIQTTKIIIDTFKKTFNHFYPEVALTNSEYDSLLGQTLFKTFSKYSKSEDELNNVIKYYRDLSNEEINKGLKAYDKAEDLLKYLKKKKISIGVVTSKMREIAKYHLELTNLYPYIDYLVGYEDVLNHKPDKEPILKALDHFKIYGENALYVGDHENDIKSAKNASILACAVTYSNRLSEMLLDNPDFVIDELINIKDLI